MLEKRGSLSVRGKRVFLEKEKGKKMRTGKQKGGGSCPTLRSAALERGGVSSTPETLCSMRRKGDLLYHKGHSSATDKPAGEKEGGTLGLFYLFGIEARGNLHGGGKTLSRVMSPRKRNIEGKPS